MPIYCHSTNPNSVMGLEDFVRNIAETNAWNSGKQVWCSAMFTFSLRSLFSAFLETMISYFVLQCVHSITLLEQFTLETFVLASLFGVVSSSNISSRSPILSLFWLPLHSFRRKSCIHIQYFVSSITKINECWSNTWFSHVSCCVIHLESRLPHLLICMWPRKSSSPCKNFKGTLSGERKSIWILQPVFKLDIQNILWPAWLYYAGSKSLHGFIQQVWLSRNSHQYHFTCTHF